MPGGSVRERRRMTVRPSSDAHDRIASRGRRRSTRRQGARAEADSRLRALDQTARSAVERPRPPRVVVDGVTRARHRAIVRARVSMAMMPCPGAGTQSSIGNGGRDPRLEPEPPQSGAGEHQRVELARSSLLQARVHVAANRCERGARNERRQLRDRAGRCRSRSSAALAEAARAIAARPARCNGASAGRTSASRGSSRGSVAAIVEPVGDDGRHVLGAVDGEVDLACGAARPRFP